jgi:hypothetical protein
MSKGLRAASALVPMLAMCTIVGPYRAVVCESVVNGIYRLKSDDGICRSDYRFNFRTGFEHQYFRGHCPRHYVAKRDP